MCSLLAVLSKMLLKPWLRSKHLLRSLSTLLLLDTISRFHSYLCPASVIQGENKKFSGDIPFYMYPPDSFPSFWGPQSSCDHSTILTEKHDGYIYAIEAMKRHPWRTTNPHEAMLAILPISIDVFSRGRANLKKPKVFIPGVSSIPLSIKLIHQT